MKSNPNESPLRVRAMLSEICVQGGYCLSPQDIEELVQAPPQTEHEFVDEILRREGLPPESADSGMRKPILEIICKWFERASRN